MRILRYILALILVSVVAPTAMATHLRAVEIQVKKTDCSSLTVEIIVTAYVNYFNTSVSFGGEGSFLFYGDGNSQAIPEIAHEVLDADLHIGRVRYTTSHTYNAPGSYVVGFIENSRNPGILNFQQSINSAFYTETLFALDPGVCNSTPVLLIPPIDRACSGSAFYHNPGAVDYDGDSLSFELFTPKKAHGTDVVEYLNPNDQSFYSSAGMDYTKANEEQNGQPTFSIDPVNGTVTWDAPGSTGEYGIAIKVREWKYDPENHIWYQSGYVIRDMQIIVEECSNERPEIVVPSEVCLIAGSTLQLDMPARDPDNHNVAIEAVSEIFTLANPALLTPANGTLQSTSFPNDTASVRIVWNTTCENVRRQPYKVVLKISDRPPAGPRMFRIYTLYVSVIAPAPEYEDVSVNPLTKVATLSWKDYSCENVEAFQVWRRISEFQYEQPECNTGMPVFLRYQLVAELPGTVLEYSDEGLAFGSQYCYRIVPLVGSARVPGRMSIDTCFIPKPAEAPVIVNVSVQHTDPQNGSMFVRWTKPFDIDPIQYPAPYAYKVFRKNESDPPTGFHLVTTNQITDTTFVDTGLNTQDNIYQYQVELYVPALTAAPVDTSSVASSVFARSQGIHDGIHITWQANTPWYNYSQVYPYHLVYRSDSPQGPFDLIDSVDVNVFDFQYTDRGQYKNLGLTGNLYYYKVETRGTYGNPKIISPLENDSQITWGQVLDTIPPCAVHATIAEVNCFEFNCDGSDYSTTIQWENDCADDVVAYEVMVKDDGASEYTLLASTQENSFVHKNILSRDKCYRLVSIDQAGNRSDSSAVVCSSNCTNFKLPNVITPGILDEQNDYLTTYPQEESNKLDCSRSVKSVILKVYSRWGDEIFTKSLEGESMVFWEGRNSYGQEVSSGVYFYHAKVNFNTNDPSAKTQEIKGWVQVIR